MRRLTILGILACVALFAAPLPVIGAPAGPPAGLDVNVLNPWGYHFVGFTSATTKGDTDGLVGMNALCQKQYPNSRICTTQDLVSTFRNTSGSSNAEDSAWIQPTNFTTFLIVDGSAHVLYFVETYSGVYVQATTSAVDLYTCSGWDYDQNGVYGLSVNAATGVIGLAGCGSSYRVACCSP